MGTDNNNIVYLPILYNQNDNCLQSSANNDTNKDVYASYSIPPEPIPSTAADCEQTSTVMGYPKWLCGDDKIAEVIFAQDFLKHHALRCINGQFVDYDGVVDDRAVKGYIYEDIKPYIISGITRKVNQLLATVKLEAQSGEIVPDSNSIHLSNGTYRLPGSFTEEKEYCFCRLNVIYNTDAPDPIVFKNFLNDLLYPDDILTLQEWFGYCLTTSTKAQKMLIIIGPGGEGKSCIGKLLKDMLGDGMASGDLNHLETCRFGLADLENRYLYLDDDIKLEAVGKTDRLKQIITNHGKIMIERKCIQAYPSYIYAKIMAFGNGNLTTLNDKTDAFYRRQIIITTKPKPVDRIDDPFMTEKLIAEKEGILLWALEGLKRLIDNDFRFTISKRAEENLRKSREDNCNIILFLGSEDWVMYDPEASIATCDLYDHYLHWCKSNCDTPLTSKTVSNYINQNLDKLGLKQDTHCKTRDGIRARGYRGMTKKS